MITEAILNVLLTPTKVLLGLLPAVDVSIPDNAFDNANSFFGALGFFLPLTWIAPIIAMKIALKSARIFMALIVRIKSFIPTMGA